MGMRVLNYLSGLLVRLNLVNTEKVPVDTAQSMWCVGSVRAAQENGARPMRPFDLIDRQVKADSEDWAVEINQARNTYSTSHLLSEVTALLFKIYCPLTT